MNEGQDWKSTWAIVVICLGLLLWARSCDGCPEMDRGKVQVNRLRGDRVEVCDGTRWVPMVQPLGFSVGPAGDHTDGGALR